LKNQTNQPREERALEIKDIKTIIELMKRNDLTHFELERDGMKLVLKKNIDPESVAAVLGNLHASAPVVQAVPVAVAPPPSTTATAPPAGEGEGKSAPASSAAANETFSIKSPMVGTFYTAPSPGQEAFVKVGDYVEAETTVCIIEAMKVMNEIKAECSGRIARIGVEDATPVAYGQVLFELKP
jgi:acetyl-CoA carboxylase biotin carboxyl carrier protein